MLKRVFESKIALAVAAVAACVALAFASVAVASHRANVSVKINKHDALNSDFHGSVKSGKKKCKKNRVVKVYRQHGHHQNLSHDTKVLKDTTEFQNGKYVWDTGNSGQDNGKYYAHVSKKHGCKADNSPTVTVNH